MENKKEPVSKTYRVRVPMYMANLLDNKLKRDGLTYSEIAREGIEKYLKKTQKK